MSTEKKGIEASFKSMDTEEFLDIYFNRPVGYAWALFFKKLGLHPNVVTILSIILGMAAGVMFYFPDMKHTLIGIFLLMWANHYDSCDGQLARMTGKKTRWGRMLDGFAGDLWFFTIYVAICLRLTNQPMPFGIGASEGMTWGIYIWLLALLSGTICPGASHPESTLLTGIVSVHDFESGDRATRSNIPMTSRNPCQKNIPPRSNTSPKV